MSEHTSLASGIAPTLCLLLYERVHEHGIRWTTCMPSIAKLPYNAGCFADDEAC